MTFRVRTFASTAHLSHELETDLDSSKLLNDNSVI